MFIFFENSMVNYIQRLLILIKNKNWPLWFGFKTHLLNHKPKQNATHTPFENTRSKRKIDFKSGAEFEYTH